MFAVFSVAQSSEHWLEFCFRLIQRHTKQSLVWELSSILIFFVLTIGTTWQVSSDISVLTKPQITVNYNKFDVFKCSYLKQEFGPMRFHFSRGQLNVLSYNAADEACRTKTQVYVHTYSDFIRSLSGSIFGHSAKLIIISFRRVYKCIL